MTILGAVHDGSGTVFVTADSGEIQSDNRSEATDLRLVEKLQQVPNRLLVWGYQGDDGRGDRIGAYLSSLGDLSDWQTLADGFGPAVRDANRSGWIETPATKTQGFVAGLVSGEGGMVVADPDGHVTLTNDFLFIGWGRIAAKVAWQVASAHPSPLPVKDRLVGLMETTIDTVWGLERPVSLWRVTGEGCEHLMGVGVGDDDR